MRTLARRSIVALKNIKAGDKLDSANIGLRRPGNGLPPAIFEQVLGLIATHDINASELLQFGDFQHEK